MIRVLNNKSAEPHVLYDPVTDRLGQFMPLNVSGRALKNDGTTRTNRVGKVCIQIEVIARSAKPFTGYWKPGKNFRAFMAALRSWGIPDVQPAGPFPKFVAVGTGGYNSPENDRDRATWLNRGGHYSHSQIPGNNHGDPGGVSFPAMLAAGKPLPTTTNTAGGKMTFEQFKAYLGLLYGPDGTEGVWNRIINGKLDLILQTVMRIEDDTDDTAAALADAKQQLQALNAMHVPDLPTGV